MPGSEIAVTVPVGALFPGVVADESSLLAALAELSRDDALFFCGRLNAMVSGLGAHRGHQERQADAVRWICSEEQQRAFNHYVAAHGGPDNVVFFFRGQLLGLARWVVTHCQNKPADGNTFDDPTLRAAFVRAALIVGELWAQRIFGARLNSPGDNRERLRQALGPFRKSLEEGNWAPEASTVVSRGWRLFSHYMQRHYPEFEALFQRSTGLTLQEYFVTAMVLVQRTLTGDRAGPIFTVPTDDPSPILPLFERYVRLKSQTPEEWARRIREMPTDTGHRALRERPILTFPRNRFLILDALFYCDGLMVSPLFHVSALTEVNSNRVFAAFGNAFEDYALEVLKVLDARLRSSLKGVDGAGRAFEIGALINSTTEGVVAEIKAVWIREDAVLTADPQDLVDETRKKYGYQPGSKERGKGPAQLARSVGALVRREWTGERGELKELKTLYPLLIVHDARMAHPGLAQLLEDDFRVMLGAVPPGIQVDRLTILTIDDLEHLTYSIDEFGLTKFLQAYSAEDPHRAGSVHNFIARSEYAARARASPIVDEVTQELLQVIRTQFALNKNRTGKP
jgi:hypothetical protein